MTTWKKLIDAALDGDTLIANTLTNEEMDTEFDNDFGGVEGKPFTAWSETRVYFPLAYDGCEWVGSAPRNPCDEACDHQGS